MAVTYTPTPLGTYNSIMSAALFSAASAATEVGTIVHRLGVSPHRVWCQTRSVVTAMLSSTPAAAVRSWNASQALIDFTAPYGDQSIIVDIYCEFVHSIAQ